MSISRQLQGLRSYNDDFSMCEALKHFHPILLLRLQRWQLLMGQTLLFDQAAIEQNCVVRSTQTKYSPVLLGSQRTANVSYLG